MHVTHLNSIIQAKTDCVLVLLRLKQVDEVGWQNQAEWKFDQVFGTPPT